MFNTQEFICKAFGYKDIIPPDAEGIIYKKKKGSKSNEEVPTTARAFSGIKTKKDVDDILIVKDNEDKRCFMCGKIHPVGYSSKTSMSSLVNKFVTNNYNQCYHFQGRDNFLCEHCGFAIASYNTKRVSPLGKNMVKCLVEKDKVTYMNFNTDDKGELYGLLKNPPKPPFVILLNPPGTVLYNMVYTALPTVSKKRIVINNGHSCLKVVPNKVFEAIEEATEIALKHDIKPDSDLIWNRADNVSIDNVKILANTSFIEDMEQFLKKYNRDTRVVAKIIYLAYRKEHKIVKKAEKKSTKSSSAKNGKSKVEFEQGNLLDDLY